MIGKCSARVSLLSFGLSLATLAEPKIAFANLIFVSGCFLSVWVFITLGLSVRA